MGGTFDPIHIGHLVLAEEARNYFGLEKIFFIPTGKPPHKDIGNITDALRRYEMTLLATGSNPYFHVSSVEINRPGITYTIDTIRYFKKQIPGSEIYFITGADSFVEISTWKCAGELLSLCKFVAARRIGVENFELERKINEMKNKFGDIVYDLPSPYIGISSTVIRERVREGKSIKYFVPEAVENYIVKNGLYIK